MEGGAVVETSGEALKELRMIFQGFRFLAPGGEELG